MTSVPAFRVFGSTPAFGASGFARGAVPCANVRERERGRPDSRPRARRLAIQGEDEPVLCRADPVRLHQVAAILVANAVRFTPSGGRVDVRVDAVDGFARLVVSDSGRGIDPAFLPHVFEGLAREAPSAPGDPDLGLSIVHELVKQLGGTLQAGSPGRNLGSTFTVSIPRHLGAGAPAS